MAHPHVQDEYAQSERNRLKVNSHYNIYSVANERQQERESGLFVSICNIPSKYLRSQQMIETAISRIVATVNNHTGYLIGGTLQQQLSNVTKKSFCLEATYRLVRADTGETRIWTGSWRNSLGRITDFEDLVTRAQLVNAVAIFSAPGAVEEKLQEFFGLESKWEFDGLVSLVINLNLRGQFGDQFIIGGHQVTFLDF